MSKFSIIIILFISLFIAGCTSTSNLSKQTVKASQAFTAGNFEAAFNLYNTYIEQQKNDNKEIEGEVYSTVGKAAFQLNKLSEAEGLFKQAYYKEYADAEMYANMISIYKTIDNLSKEIDALEYFVANYSTDARFEEYNQRLFETYVESENWDKAIVIWSSFSEEKQSEVRYMELFLFTQQKLENNTAADELANDILKKNSTSKIALEHMADKYFWKAENQYQKEMTAYEKNKTNKQYLVMLEALDGVTIDFKKSLSYYEKLYKNYPSKEYAKYMANIYARFQDKENTEYYRKLAK